MGWATGSQVAEELYLGILRLLKKNAQDSTVLIDEKLKRGIASLIYKEFSNCDADD